MDGINRSADSSNKGNDLYFQEARFRGFQPESFSWSLIYSFFNAAGTCFVDRIECRSLWEVLPNQSICDFHSIRAPMNDKDLRSKLLFRVLQRLVHDQRTLFRCLW